MDSDIQSIRETVTCLAPCKVMTIITEEIFFFFNCLKPIAKYPCSMQWQHDIQNSQLLWGPFSTLLYSKSNTNFILFPNRCNAKPSYPRQPTLSQHWLLPASSLQWHYLCQEKLTFCIKVSCCQMFYSACSSGPSQDDIAPSSTERWKSWTVVLD